MKRKFDPTGKEEPREESEFYDSHEYAESYEEHAQAVFERHQVGTAVAHAFNRYLPAELPLKETIICERAAGTGIITEELAKFGYQVRASDLNMAPLKILENKQLANVTIHGNDDLNKPMNDVKNGSVHGVVEVGATRFMTPGGQKTFIKEAQRVLIEGGILIWPIFFGERMPQDKARRPTSETVPIAHLLEKSGFEVLEANFIWDGIRSYHLLVAKKNSEFKAETDQYRELKLFMMQLKIKTK